VRLRGLVGACVAVIAAVAATGCGSTGIPEAGDAIRGKELFVKGCGQCHTLADAGTKGVIGPNLDDGFRQARVDGLGETTIASVVRAQIAFPVEEPVSGSPGMPADIYTGKDADSVADYVSSVAGLPARGGSEATGGGTGGGGEEGGGEAADGEAIFAEAGCGGCHTLEAAGSSGTVGPNLDDAKPSKELAVDRVTNGRGAMPSFKDSYSAAQIEAVATYVADNAGKSSSP
jgi:mono/diheme cytochrome c family protein